LRRRAQALCGEALRAGKMQRLVVAMDHRIDN
jgi:hypothetical protein